MLRTKSFTMMDVISVNGKKVGFIKDILINFHEGIITGFLISPYNLFVRSSSVLREDIVSFSNTMIVKKTSKKLSLKLKDFCDMDIIDRSGNIIGVFEDIIFDNSFHIKGVIISSGFINKLYRGKKVVLINEMIIGENNILFIGNNKKLNFTSMPHNFAGVD